MISEITLKKFELFRKFSNIETTIISEERVIYCSYDLKNIEQLTIYEKAKNLPLSNDQITLVTHNSLECYGMFPYADALSKYMIIIGPILTVRPISTENLKYLSFYNIQNDDTIRKFASMIPQLSLAQFTSYLELIFHEVTGILYTQDNILQNKVSILSFLQDDDFTNVVSLNELSNNPITRIYEDIQRYIDVIKNGDLMSLKKLLSEQVLFYQFSNALPKRNLYNLISLSALLGKAAVDAGLDFYDSSALGATLITLAEDFTRQSDFIATFKKLVTGYTNQVHHELTKNNYSKSIKRAISYIDRHIHYNISLEEVSEYVNLSRPYLSQLFSKEVGMTLQTYIQDRKMSEAENLIKFSKMSISEVASSLSYCSQSYFTEVFKKKKSMTPLEFRKKVLNQT